ncbi:phage tailspike protein, partial [Escherichia coli]
MTDITANVVVSMPSQLFTIVTNGAIVIHTQRLKSDPGG